MRKVLKAKIHRATVTQADLHYEGSITIPPDLMQAADICEYEAVSVWNITAGTRFETYAITGREGERHICINGAAARLAQPSDLVIIAAFAYKTEEAMQDFKPKLVFVDKDNRQLDRDTEVAGPHLPPGHAERAA